MESVLPLSTPDFLPPPLEPFRCKLRLILAGTRAIAGGSSGQVLREGARAVGLLPVSLLFRSHGHGGGPPAQQRGPGPPGDAQVDPWAQLSGSGVVPPEGGFLLEAVFFWIQNVSRVLSFNGSRILFKPTF